MTRIALVAGATRGAGRGIATALGEVGFTVYCTGRGSRSDYGRPETLAGTVDRVNAAGGTGIAVEVDHSVPEEVAALVERIDAEQGRLDLLVNDIWGGERLFEFGAKLWEHDLANGLSLIHRGLDTHLITSHKALPLLIKQPGGLVIEMTDGVKSYNDANYRNNVFYDLVKTAVVRMAWALSKDLEPYGCTALALSPGWLRSEMMLEAFGVTEETWREAKVPHFNVISESPLFVGRAVAALATDPDVAKRSGGSFSSGGLAKEYGFTDHAGEQPDCWQYMVDNNL